MSSTPKHRQVYDFIRLKIRDGGYTPGEQLPTDAQLMRQFSASRPTVARAMRDLEQAGILDRRAGAGSFVCLQEKSVNNLVGLLIPELGDTEIFGPICGELARACQKNGLSLLWGDTPRVEGAELLDKAESLCRQYIQQGVLGVFFAPVELTEGMEETNRLVATMLDQAGIAVVLLDRDYEPYPKRSRFDLVSIDNFRVGFSQASHAIQLGCKRVAYFARPHSAPTVNRRIGGYRESLIEHGMKLSDKLIFRGDPADVAFVKEILTEKPEAILCANDSTAAQLMQSLGTLDVKVPDEVRIIGVDDVRYARLLSVPLTTIRQPCRAIGQAAVQALLRRIENRSAIAQDVNIDFDLVVRQSCGQERDLAEG